MKHFFNLGSFFNDVVEKNKKNTALYYLDSQLTYNELNKLSNKLSNLLIKEGIKKRDVVGIFNTKNPIGYASMLACLKIGAIYTNIDEENPPERIKKIIETAKPSICIFDYSPTDEIPNILNSLNTKNVILSPENYKKILHEYDENNIYLNNEITGSNPAYLMFTSGSTGTPKGVLISHQSIVSFIKWSIEKYEITPKDRFIQLSPMYFDNSVFDFYSTFFSGAGLVPVKKEITKNPLELIKLAENLKCTIWFSVPSLLVFLLTMKALRKGILESIRIFTFGGEGFPKGELKKLYDTYKDQAKIVNVYGPTEGTCICSSYDISDKDFKDMGNLAPLGPINPNFEFIIIDEAMNLVKPSNKGELCLIGPNISLGYFNNEEKTKQSFVQNPLIKEYKDIIYKTGDIVYEKDGLLYFSGRIDNQIKHMGYRIELEDIESSLNGLRYVNQSAVIYHREKEKYGKIIAFVTTSEQIDENKILEDLRNYLPPYMIPNVLIIQDTLQKNANGKINRKELQNQWNKKSLKV